MMRIWKRALAIVLALALVVPTPAFADEVVEDYVVPEALTPELDDELYGVDSFAEDDDFMVEPDDGFGADEWDLGADAAGGDLEAGGLIEDMDADSGDAYLQDAMMHSAGFLFVTCPEHWLLSEH